MRLYDFHCDACGHDFEDLVRDLGEARCKKCGSDHVAKQISAPAVGGKGEGRPALGDCNVMSCGRGACGSGGCGLN